MRSFKSVSRCVAVGMLVGAIACVAYAQAPSAPPAPPFIRITGFVSGTVSGGCTAPSAELTVAAEGTAQHSDTFKMWVNGALTYTWTGETMAWVATSATPITYGINGATGAYAANAVITGKIVTYDGVNSTAANPTTGQRAVYESEISWNCTTGAQVGDIVSRDLRAPRDIPSAPMYGLAALMFALAGAGLHSRRRVRRCQDLQ